jgi:hypothetical protein
MRMIQMATPRTAGKAFNRGGPALLLDRVIEQILEETETLVPQADAADQQRARAMRNGGFGRDALRAEDLSG